MTSSSDDTRAAGRHEPVEAATTGVIAGASRAAAAAVDLGAVVAALFSTPEWQSESRSSCALLHTPELRVVVTALHAGATMHNDDPDEAVTVQGIQGSAVVLINDASADLGEGCLLCVPGGVAWKLSATTDAVVLLTVVRA